MFKIKDGKLKMQNKDAVVEAPIEKPVAEVVVEQPEVIEPEPMLEPVPIQVQSYDLMIGTPSGIIKVELKDEAELENVIHNLDTSIKTGVMITIDNYAIIGSKIDFYTVEEVHKDESN